MHYIHFTPSGIKITSKFPYLKLESGVNRPQLYFNFAITTLRPYYLILKKRKSMKTIQEYNQLQLLIFFNVRKKELSLQPLFY